MNSIEESEKYGSDYEYLSPIISDYKDGEEIFSIIIDCYYGLGLLRESIKSVLNQSYSNVELILIDNGAHSNVSIYIYDIYKNNKNVALIKFNENQFFWNDTEKMIVICWNIGVRHSKGSVIRHLAYDDMLSLDCIERMSKLFSNNKNCVTAAPLPVSVDINGNINKEISNLMSLSNQRPRYMNGKEIALDFIQFGPKNYFSAPGGILFIKKNIILSTGGFDRSSDVTQIIKFAIHGESGFDSKAKIFWRHHKGQLNKIAKNKGIVWCRDLEYVVKNEKIIDMWRDIFTLEQTKMLINYVVTSVRSDTFDIVKSAIRQKQIVNLFIIMKNIAYKCPDLFLYILRLSILEMGSMFVEKFFGKIRIK
jgi:glycosyltransferase involved in cell wall biosynthesis